MATYRLLTLDLVTGTPVADVTLSGLQYGLKLNDAGTASGKLTLPTPVIPKPTAYLDIADEYGNPLAIEAPGSPTRSVSAAVSASLVDAVAECRRQLVIERDATIVWCGIVWTAPYNDEDQSLAVGAAEDWSYFRRRRISTTVNFAATDQFLIARALIAAAQGQAGGNIRVTMGTELSGVWRDRTYNRFELKKVAEAIEDMADDENGFDFAIEPSWDPQTGALVKTLRFYYPRRGRNYAATNLVFRVGQNVRKWSWPSDGTRTANRLWGIGGGQDEAMLLTSASDVQKLTPLAQAGPGYPLLEDSLSLKDISDPAVLASRTRAALPALSDPKVAPTLVVDAGDPKIGTPEFGKYIVGDTARFVVPPNLSPRFPTGYDAYHRITAVDVKVSDEGDEEITLTLGVEP